MKKILTLLLSMCMLLCLGISLTACGDNSDTNKGDCETHTLVFVEENPATCEQDGVRAHYKCSVCKALFLDELGKIKASNISLRITAAHSFGDDNICDLCGQPNDNENPSENPDNPLKLRFELNSDGQSYKIAGVMQDFQYMTELVLPDTYNDKPVTIIGENAFYGTMCSSVVIPDTVTTIETGAFRESDYLCRVTIGSSVTDIDEYSFYASEKLTEVYNRSTLSFDNESQYGYLCRALNTYTPESGESKMTFREEGFITYLDGADTILISYIGSQTELTLTDDITKIGNYAFVDDDKIVSLIIPDSVTEIGDYAFCNRMNTSALTNVDFGSNIVQIGKSAFKYCRVLEDIDLPSALKYIGDSAFAECEALVEINIPQVEYSYYLGTGAWAFEKCISLETVYVNSKDVFTAMFKDCISLKNVSIGTNTEKIKGSAFSGCTSLKTIAIPASVMRIESEAFYGTGLESVSFASGVNVIGASAFEDCVSLTSINTPLTISEIGRYAFRNCTALQEVIVQNPEASVDTTAFEGCDNAVFQELIYDNLQYGVDGEAGYSVIGHYYLWDGDVYIPNTYNGKKVFFIHNEAFKGNTKITKLTLSYNLYQIKENAFNGCTNLAGVRYAAVANSDFDEVNLHYIMESAFEGCTNLKSFMIGYASGDDYNSQGIHISNNAFKNCTNLTVIYSSVGTAFWNDYVKINNTGNETFSNATVYLYSSNSINLAVGEWSFDENGEIVVNEGN